MCVCVCVCGDAVCLILGKEGKCSGDLWMRDTCMLKDACGHVHVYMFIRYTCTHVLSFMVCVCVCVYIHVHVHVASFPGPRLFRLHEGRHR